MALGRECPRDECDVTRTSSIGMELHLAREHELPDEFVVEDS